MLGSTPACRKPRIEAWCPHKEKTMKGKKDFIKFFIEKYGKDYNMKSELFRSLLLDFEEHLGNDREKRKRKKP